MMLSFKPGVDVRDVKPEAVLAMVVAEMAFRLNAPAIPCVVTAVRNGKHMANSLHGKGFAFDLRLPSRYSGRRDDDTLVHGVLRDSLGAQYDVLLERFPDNPDNDHIHVEFDPAPPGPELT